MNTPFDLHRRIVNLPTVYFMHENHTFRRIDVECNEDAFSQIKKRFTEDSYGILLTKATPEFRTLTRSAPAYEPVTDEEIHVWLCDYYDRFKPESTQRAFSATLVFENVYAGSTLQFGWDVHARPKGRVLVTDDRGNTWVQDPSDTELTFTAHTALGGTTTVTITSDAPLNGPVLTKQTRAL